VAVVLTAITHFQAEELMKTITTIGLVWQKRVFQVHDMDQMGDPY
jgi:hypothetical protein